MQFYLKKVIFLYILFNLCLGSTITVDQSGNGDFITMNEAINSASEGDTIKVMPGYYIEALSIGSFNKLSIIGTDPQNCIFYNGGDVLSIRDNYNANQEYYIASLTLYSNNGNSVYYQSENSNNGLINFVNCIFKSRFYLYNNYNQINVNNCVFNSNGDGFYSYYNYSTINFSNTIFYSNNNAALNIYSGTGSANLISCIMFNNTVGLSNSSGNVLSLYSLYYNNGGNPPSGETNIYEDPLFRDEVDFLLEPNSPCIDAGIPTASYNDLNNTRNDIGLHGGPNAPYGLGPVITNFLISPDPVSVGGSITIEATATSE